MRAFEVDLATPEENGTLMKLTKLLGALVFASGFIVAGCGEDKGTTTGASAGGGTATTTTTPASGGGAAMSDDDAHKLYQAAAMTGDSQMIMDVNKKIGLLNADGSANQEKMTKFTTEHGAWAQKNTSFLQEINTPEKAKEYVKKHK